MVDESKIDDAVLALLHLTAWEERYGWRAWKGFDWDAMNRLHEAGMINDPVSKAKSVALTDDGAARAAILFEQLFGDGDTDTDNEGVAVQRDGQVWTHELMQQLRGAVGRGDVDAVAAILDLRPAIEVVHLAAPALISGVLVGHTRVIEIVESVSAAMAKRRWEGDDELVTEFARATGQDVHDLSPIPVDLGELAMHLDGPPDDYGGYRLELSTGYFLPLDFEAMTGEPEPDDWEDPDRYLHVDGLGSRDGYRDMEDFIALVTDEHVAERLLRAINGRGAFRRFKDTVHEDDRWLTEWRRFSGERQTGRARAWLREEGFRPGRQTESGGPAS